MNAVLAFLFGITVGKGGGIGSNPLPPVLLSPWGERQRQPRPRILTLFVANSQFD